jgi:hypothetical protein
MKLADDMRNSDGPSSEVADHLRGGRVGEEMAREDVLPGGTQGMQPGEDLDGVAVEGDDFAALHDHQFLVGEAEAPHQVPVGL